VSMTPEYLRHWNALADAAAPRAIVIGELDARSGDLVERLFAPFGSPIHRMPIRAAEFHKYAHNLANAAKISLFNELRETAVSIGVDADRVFGLVTETAEGLWNAAYGTLDLGSFEGCLSKDVRAFLTWAAERGLELPVVSGAEETNHRSERG
jgi:UDP-glucose 6-dehydrogenase